MRFLAFSIVIILLSRFICAQNLTDYFESNNFGSASFDLGCEEGCIYSYMKSKNFKETELTITGGPVYTGSVTVKRSKNVFVNFRVLPTLKVVSETMTNDFSKLYASVDPLNVSTILEGTLFYTEIENTAWDTSADSIGTKKYSKIGYQNFLTGIRMNFINADLINNHIYLNFLKNLSINTQQLLKKNFELNCKISGMVKCKDATIFYSNELLNDPLKSLWYTEEENNDQCGLGTLTTEETLFYGKPMKIVYSFNVPDRPSIDNKHYWKCDNKINGCTNTTSTKKWLAIKDKKDVFTSSYNYNEPDLAFGLSKAEILKLASNCNFQVDLSSLNGTDEIEKIDNKVRSYYIGYSLSGVLTEEKVNKLNYFTNSSVLRNLLYHKKNPSSLEVKYKLAKSITEDYYYTFLKVDLPNYFDSSYSMYINKDYNKIGHGQWYLAFSKVDLSGEKINIKQRILRDGTSTNACYVRIPLNRCTNKFPRVIDTEDISDFVKLQQNKLKGSVIEKITNVKFEDGNTAITNGIELEKSSVRRLYINPLMVYNEIYLRFYSKQNERYYIPLTSYSSIFVAYENNNCDSCSVLMKKWEYATGVPLIKSKENIFIKRENHFTRNTPVNGHVDFGFYNVFLNDDDYVKNKNYLYSGMRAYPTTPAKSTTFFIEPSYYFYQELNDNNSGIVFNEPKIKGSFTGLIYNGSYGLPLGLLIGGAIPVDGTGKPTFTTFDNTSKITAELKKGMFQYMVGMGSFEQKDVIFTLRFHNQTLTSDDLTNLSSGDTGISIFKKLHDTTKMAHLNDKTMIFLYENSESRINTYTVHEALSISGVRFKVFSEDNVGICKNVVNMEYHVGSVDRKMERGYLFFKELITFKVIEVDMESHRFLLNYGDVSKSKAKAFSNLVINSESLLNMLKSNSGS